MVRFRYSSHLTPAAPFAQITLIRPDDENRRLELVPAQLDTAADCTVILQHVADQLQLEQSGSKLILGFGGLIQQRPTFGVHLQIRGHDLRVLVNCVADHEEPYVLVGRDVLNQFRIVFDGPAAVIQIE